MKLNEEQLVTLLRTLDQTEDAEMDCGHCLAAVSAYAERELAGKTMTEAFERVHQHLTVCSDCREEYSALLEAISGFTSGS